MSYKYFQHKECEWYPCHKCTDINCLFCFCPLYSFKNCGGNFITLENGLKDCSNCILPHKSYDYIINKIKEINKEST